MRLRSFCAGVNIVDIDLWRGVVAVRCGASAVTAAAAASWMCDVIAAWQSFMKPTQSSLGVILRLQETYLLATWSWNSGPMQLFCMMTKWL